ncbi:hypothetical protein ZOSMA_93G00710 [Zostera marina]|uniref:Uncharacterized protein n=1 Tax=Zostera marina TaxID=29655 RepID=A0A0K9NKM4_ZOSMR|nr:hypothetical protein ZOSMA_93G00710 [Zostera marina]
MTSAFTPSPSSIAGITCGSVSSSTTIKQLTPTVISLRSPAPFVGQYKKKNRKERTSGTTVVSAYGDVSADGTTYLVGGAIAVALIGTAFPIFFSRKDMCPECDGAGFVRSTGVTLKANAARKDLKEIVCKRCNGLGKLGQIDKK